MFAVPSPALPARPPHRPFRRLSASAAFALALAAPVLAQAAPETWRIDPVHSQVWFSVSHDGYSYPQGRLRIASGWFQFDADDWSTARVDATIDLDSVDMGDAKWNAAVKSGQFLGTARWPSARLVGERVTQIDTSNGVIHGNLSLHGETRPLDVAFTFNRIGVDPYAFRKKAGFSAQASLSRSAFGMTRYADVVGDEVTVRIEIEGVLDRNAAPATVESATKANEEHRDGAEK